MNGQTKHTPGPWDAYAFRESEDVRGAMVRVLRPATDATRANPDICRVFAIGDDGRPGGEMEANARLIAAAPAMLAAGTKLAAWAARAVERWESGDLAEAVRNLDYARREWIKAVEDVKGVK